MTPRSALWSPSPAARAETGLGRFTTFCEHRHGVTFDGYDDLWRWSTGDGLEDCWHAIWDFFDVTASVPFEEVLGDRVMPGASWFPGARLNYAEHALRSGADRRSELAIVGLSQSRERVELTWGALEGQVASVRAGLRRLGVRRGDRVAAYLPNIPETIVAFLATASLGAVWTSCAPEFGVNAVLDRFTQVEPTVLLAVDGYRYGSRRVDRSSELAEIRAGLPTLRHTVVVGYLGDTRAVAASTSEDPGLSTWDDLHAVGPSTEALEFEQVPADHPLYVLFSSGTTGLPKAIVHGHGGILLEHLKVIGLHSDMNAQDRFLWFTTTGWMMWNYLVSGLLVGARVVVFDGDPNHDGPDTLWRIAADEQLTWLGVGAPYITACRRAGLRPIDTHDLSSLRAVGSTGAPLSAEGFRWVHDAVSPSAMISPISGGTDVCSAFVGGSPMTPVYEGEIPCRYLGAAVASFDDAGGAVIGEQGELVITEPMPSMPVGFWGDVDEAAYRAAYFDHFPGVWRHGDWITITERGSCVISGRSDATLNRGGVRVGTAEIYRVVESVPGVLDSLVVHLESSGEGDGDRLVLFVVIDTGADPTPVEQAVRATVRAEISPRHVPDEIHRVDAIPTTLSGKKLEVPVKRLLLGADPARVASRDSLKDPSALEAIAAIAARPGG
ncbi:MAG: acetoacetate--CoA ligase [Ilumatobacteraceae bacterium]